MSTTTQKQRMPAQQFRLSCGVELLEAKAEDGSQQFTAIANTGAPMRHPYVGKLVVDMSTLKIPRQDVPVLRDHDPGQIAGHTLSMKKTQNGLEVKGRLTAKTAAGQEIISLLHDGHPWQLSVWVPPERVQFLQANESAQVNGAELKGPAAILRGSDVREVTFTALGMDQHTRASKLAAGADEIEVEIETLTAPVEAPEQTMTKTEEPDKGKASTLTPEQLKAAKEIIRTERDARSAFLAKHGAGCSDELRAKLLDSEATEVEMLAAICADLNASRTAAIEKLGKLNANPGNVTTTVDDKATGKVDAGNADALKDAALSALRAEWEKDSELRTDYLEDFESFRADRAHPRREGAKRSS